MVKACRSLDWQTRSYFAELPTLGESFWLRSLILEELEVCGSPSMRRNLGVTHNYYCRVISRCKNNVVVDPNFHLLFRRKLFLSKSLKSSFWLIHVHTQIGPKVMQLFQKLQSQRSSFPGSHSQCSKADWHVQSKGRFCAYNERPCIVLNLSCEIVSSKCGQVSLCVFSA